MQIYVGNLSFKMVETDLRKAFERYGEVSRVNLVTDRETGRPRGFGFVEMPEVTAAKAAISALDGKELEGRELTVNEARPKTFGRAESGNRQPLQRRESRGFNHW